MPRPLTLRPFAATDAAACAALFYRTVHQVNRQDYTPGQLEAWAPVDFDREAFGRRFAGRWAYVAVADDAIVGFTDMTPTGHLDRLFVAATHQRQGIASRLLARLLAEAQQRSLQHLTTEASVTAKPFFEAFDFRVVAEQTVQRRGVGLKNFRMTRALP